MDNVFILRVWRSLECEAMYLHEIADGFAALRLTRDWVRLYDAERPHAALDGQTPADAYGGETPVDMMDNPLRALPISPQSISSNREILSSGFCQPEHQPENTSTKPPSCPKR